MHLLYTLSGVRFWQMYPLLCIEYIPIQWATTASTKIFILNIIRRIVLNIAVPWFFSWGLRRLTSRQEILVSQFNVFLKQMFWLQLTSLYFMSFTSNVHCISSNLCPFLNSETGSLYLELNRYYFSRQRPIAQQSYFPAWIWRCSVALAAALPDILRESAHK